MCSNRTPEVLPIHSLKRWMGSFSDQERQVNKMLTFLFLLKMHIMDLVSAECFLCLQSARSSTSTQHWVWRWLRQSEAGPTSWSTGQRCGDWCAMSWWQSRTAGHLLHDPPIRPAAMRDFRWVSYSSFIAFLDLRIFDQGSTKNLCAVTIEKWNHPLGLKDT